MRRDLVMAGQPYRLAGRTVTVDTVYADGRVALTDGTAATCRSLSRTPPKRPGSRTLIEPHRAKCPTCSARPGAVCRTRRGDPTSYHYPRLRALPTRTVRVVTGHAPAPARQDAE